MEPQPGIRDSGAYGLRGWLAAGGRMVGFCLLAGAAVAIFAATLLVPEYARMERAQYELARQEAVNADLKALIEANDRLIAALPASPVLTKRLAMNQFALVPEDEFVLVSDAAPHVLPPGAGMTRPHPKPAPPDEQTQAIARRLSRPRTRRGLLLLAAAAMLAALFLFPAGEREKRRAPAAAGQRGL